MDMKGPDDIKCWVNVLFHLSLVPLKDYGQTCIQKKQGFIYPMTDHEYTHSMHW